MLYEKLIIPAFSPYASIGVICGSFISAVYVSKNKIPSHEMMIHLLPLFLNKKIPLFFVQEESLALIIIFSSYSYVEKDV